MSLHVAAVDLHGTYLTRHTAFYTMTSKMPEQTNTAAFPQPAIDHYGAVSTFHDDNIFEACFSMLRAGSLELTTEN